MRKIVKILNKILPAARRLSDNATEDEVADAVASLEDHKTLRVMMTAESKSKHTTRPRIALGAFYVIAFAIITAISMWAVGVLRADDDLIRAVMDGWPFVLAVVGPFTSLLWAYFGILKNEQADRLNAAAGIEKAPGIIKKLLKLGS